MFSLKRTSFLKLSLTTLCLLAVSISAYLFYDSNNSQNNNVINRDGSVDPVSLDFSKTVGYYESRIIQDLFTGLLMPDENGNPVPGIAKSWDKSKDGLTYTFHLRESNWSNGEPVTAHDFAYMIKKVADPQNGTFNELLINYVKNGYKILKGIEKDSSKLGVKVIDDYTLEIKLEKPTPFFLNLLMLASFPMHQRTIEKYQGDWTKPENIVSNGAYKLVKWVPNLKIELIKNALYFESDNVKTEKIVYHFVNDSNTKIQKFRTGELDITDTLEFDKYDFVLENLKNETHVIDTMSTRSLVPNVSKPPFKDNPKLVQAISLAIDREALSKIYKGTTIPLYNIIAPNVESAPAGIQDNELSKMSAEERMKLAKQLYREATNDNPLKIKILYPARPELKAFVTIIAQMLKPLGLEVEHDPQEWKVWAESTMTHNFEMTTWTWPYYYNDPISLLENFTIGHNNNKGLFNNEYYDNLLLEANAASNAKVRSKKLLEASNILSDQGAVIPVGYRQNIILVSPQLEGFTKNPLVINLSRYLSKKSPT